MKSILDMIFPGPAKNSRAFWWFLAPQLLGVAALVLFYIVYYFRYVIIWDDFSSEFLHASYFINHYLRFGELPTTYFYNYCAQPVWPLRFGWILGLPLIPFSWFLSLFHEPGLFFLYDVYVLSRLSMALFGMIGCYLLGSLFLKRPASFFLMGIAYSLPVFWTQQANVCQVSPYMPWFLYFTIRVVKDTSFLSLVSLLVLSVCAFYSCVTYAFFAGFYLLLCLLLAYVISELSQCVFGSQTIVSIYQESVDPIIRWLSLFRRRPLLILLLIAVLMPSIGVIYTYVSDQSKIYDYARDYFDETVDFERIRMSSIQETYGRLSIGAHVEASPTRSGFVGTTVILLAAISLLGWKNRYTRLFSLTFLLMIMIYCTPPGIVFLKCLFTVIPALSLFKYFIVFLAGMCLLLCCLAALGLEWLLDSMAASSAPVEQTQNKKKGAKGSQKVSESSSKSIYWALCIILGLGVVSTIFIHSSNELIGDANYFAYLTVCMVALLLALKYKIVNETWAPVIICLIVFLEVAAYSHSKLLAVSRSAVPDGQRKVLATIQQNDPYRLQFNMIFPHYPAYKSRNTIEGESRADEFPPTIYLNDFYGYDFGSNAFQGHITLPFWTSWSRKQMYGEYHDLLTVIEKNPLAQRDLWMSVANEDTKMYAFYHQAYVAPDREDVLEIMKNIWFSMDNLILESQPKNEDDSLRLPITPETYNPEPIMRMETARALKEGPVTANDIHLEIESDKPGFIVFFINIGYGWNAAVNGVKTEVEKAFGTFAALEIPAGKSEIHLESVSIWGGWYIWVMGAFFYAMIGLGIVGAFLVYRRLWTDGKFGDLRVL